MAMNNMFHILVIALIIVINNVVWIVCTSNQKIDPLVDMSKASMDSRNRPSLQTIVDGIYGTRSQTDMTIDVDSASLKRDIAQKQQGLLPALLPNHIGLIVDGNGRWATSRGLVRTEGHRKGLLAIVNTIRTAHLLGIAQVTAYLLSTENLKRPESELSFLFHMLDTHLTNTLKEVSECTPGSKSYPSCTKIRFAHIGNPDHERIPVKIRNKLKRIHSLSKKRSPEPELIFTMAIVYTGKESIAEACSSAVASKITSNTKAPFKISVEDIQDAVETSTLHSLDLIIRSSGEQRLSGFLTWESAYAEFVFDNVLWPDYKADDLANNLRTFQSRDRRFGNIPVHHYGHPTSDGSDERSISTTEVVEAIEAHE